MMLFDGSVLKFMHLLVEKVERTRNHLLSWMDRKELSLCLLWLEGFSS